MPEFESTPQDEPLPDLLSLRVTDLSSQLQTLCDYSAEMTKLSSPWGRELDPVVPPLLACPRKEKSAVKAEGRALGQPHFAGTGRSVAHRRHPIPSALITVAVPSQPTWPAPFGCATPGPIPRLRRYWASTLPQLSGPRLGGYSPRSTSLSDLIAASIAWKGRAVKLFATPRVVWTLASQQHPCTNRPARR